jgi:glycosyltransferase involved in cell wall biosynthesis
MRIGLLTDVFRPGFSGVANHVLLLKQSFEKLGQKVSVFAFESRKKIPSDPNVFYSPGITLAANYPFGFFPSARALERLREMDILHAHQPFTSGFVALQEHRRRGVPVVFTSHTRYDLYSKSYLPWMPASLSTAAIRWFLRVPSRPVALMIAPSPEMRDLLRSWKVDTRIEVIPNGIELDAFHKPLADRNKLRHGLGLPVEEFLYLYVGRIAAEKNIEFLLACFKSASAQAAQARLVLVGGGPRLHEVQNRVQADSQLSEKVILTGPVEYSRIPDYMSAADTFVTASKTEVHPLTVIEAAASGLPAVALRAPGVSSIIQDEVTGFLCPEDVEIFSGRMLILLRDAAIRQALSQNALRASEAYSSDRTAAHLLQEYQKILQNRI